jgi:hypothetical protein
LKANVGITVGSLLLLSVGGGMWYSHQRSQDGAHRPALSVNASQQSVIHGLIGSEKEAFFNDPRVQARLAALQLSVQVDKAGSRSMPSQLKTGQYDFAFPAGTAQALQIQQQSHARSTDELFYTPMVIATWKPVVAALDSQGLIHSQGNTQWVDMRGLLPLMLKQTRWSDLNSPASSFRSNKSIIITTTDLKTSNSAGTYLALMSYLVNHEQIVQNPTEATQAADQVKDLFGRQGYQESSSAAPFEDYLALGMGKTPLLMTYESQLIQYQYQQKGAVDSNIAVLYPVPTLYTKHVFVPLNARAEALQHALGTDPQLLAIAHEYGFRTKNPAATKAAWQAQGIQTPDRLDDVIDPPNTALLDLMIDHMSQPAAATP